MSPQTHSPSTGVGDLAAQARQLSDRHYKTGNWERAAAFGHIANTLTASRDTPPVE